MMDKPRWTPGEWKAVRKCVGHVITPTGGYPEYVSFVEPLDIMVFGPDWKHTREHEGPESTYICANARLIAAAPVLAKAAEPIVNIPGISDEDWTDRDYIEVPVADLRALAAAYRKALGET